MSDSVAVRVGWREMSRRLLLAWRVCWRSGRLLATGQVVAAVAAGLLSPAVIWSTKELVDGLVGGTSGPVVLGIAGIAGAGVLGACAIPVTDYLAARLDQRTSFLMTDELFTAINGFGGLSRFEDPAVLDRIRAAQQGAMTSVGPATTGMMAAARDVLSLVGLLVTVWLLSPVMSVVILASAVPVLFAQLSLSRRYVSMLGDMAVHNRRQIQFMSLTSDVRAVKELRLFGLGDYFKRRILTELAASNDAQRDLDRRQLDVQSLLSLLSSVVSAGGLVWAVWACFQHRLTVGEVSAFATAAAASQASLRGLVAKVTRAHRALLTLGFHLDVTSMPPDLPAVRPAAAAPVVPALDRIDLRDVWFRYGDTGPWVLRAVDLTIRRGETVGLVGLNGAGKSTLVKLLCRFYDPTEGAVLWNGTDIRAFPAEELRRQLGVLFQDFMQYDLTASENIGIGNLARIGDAGSVSRAAAVAGIHDTLAALPRGYETMLSRVFFTESDRTNGRDGVTTLSGGQWQRVALARSLMRTDPELLILDEPTSGVDAQAESEIHQRITAHRRGRTSLLISHRLGAIREADRIVVLADGRVAEEGGHDELMRSGGRYARLFTVQAKGYRATGEREPA